jgi:methylglutamate dehydrogenase subunit B
MLIPCPHCGLRGSEEFVYRGDATVRRPAIGAEDAAGAAMSPAWLDYLYLRDNPTGEHREFWYHATGCRAWLIVTRNVTTHEIVAVEVARAAPDGASAKAP